MANDTITHLLNANNCNPFIPKAALVVFSSSNDSFLELHPIRRDGSMAEGRPVSQEFIQNLLSSFSQEYRSVPHGETPSNLLFCDTRRGRETYIWYNPPCKRQRFFDERLNLKDGVYHVPGTLYVVHEGQLSVYCFAGKTPAKDKPLLGVPYFNVYGSGNVCMGNSHPKIPDTDKLSFEDIMLAWEKAFWYSKDVHTNGSPSTKHNLVETIKRYKDKAFDTKELEVRQDGLTINTIIRKYA